jgi:hypothetical protein
MHLRYEAIFFYIFAIYKHSRLYIFIAFIYFIYLIFTISSLNMYCSCKFYFLCGEDTHVINRSLSQITCFCVLNYIISMKSISAEQEAIIS